MQSNRSHKTAPLAALALALLAAILLAACGSSSKGSSTASSTASSAAAPRAGRFTALRECLKKEGITLPQRVPGKPGSPPAGGAVPFGGGFRGGQQLPKGVTRAQFEAALKKCGGGSGGRFGGGGRLRSTTFKKALEKFAVCMRQNGVDVPTPNTSGSGPVFSTKGLDTSSAKFRAAQQKCSSLLNVGRPGGQGAPGAAGQNGPGAGPPEGAAQ